MWRRKYRRKPPEGTPARVKFDGKRLTWPEGNFDEKISGQAEANARFVARLLEKRTGKRIVVRPVVMLPGWYVEDYRPRPRWVWVMADWTLHGFLARERRKMSGTDVGLVYESLAEYVRNKGR